MSFALVAIFLTAAAGFHPQDGPDVDLRVHAEPNLVRLTALMNLAFVDEVVAVPREQELVLDPAEIPALEAAIRELFARRCPLAIDGTPRPPTGAELVLLPVATEELFLYPRLGLKGVTRVRFEASWRLEESPRSLRLTWGLFPPDLAIADREDARPITVVAEWTVFGDDRMVTFTPDEPTFVLELEEGAARRAALAPVPPPPPARPATRWPLLSYGLILTWIAIVGVIATRRRRVPARAVLVSATLVFVAAFFLRGVLAVPLGGDDPPRAVPRAEALGIFETLLRNVYRAFDYEDEERVYDALAASIDGPLLDAVYDEIYRSLILQDEGGARSRVTALEVLEATATPRADGAAFDVRARWRVDGRVFHWGHEHLRSNVYVARFLVAPRERGWRIVAHDTLEQTRVEPDGPR